MFVLLDVGAPVVGSTPDEFTLFVQTYTLGHLRQIVQSW